MEQKRPFSQEELLGLSQHEKLVSALRDGYRYSALGALVKGVVHNLNGALQILSMQMELLQGMLAKGGEKISPTVHAKMEQCFGQLDKFKGMIEGLAQKGAHEEQDVPQAIRLNDLIEEELSVLHHHLFFKHQVKVKKVLGPNLPLMKGYYIDFSIGLQNLLLNAVEAMEETPEKEMTILTEAEDQSIRVMIKDTGCGISEENKPHLFSPFFTTKGGSHYGLGLFMARELLARYGASFHCSSQKGETVFSVIFPLKAAEAGEVMKGPK